MTVTYSQRVSCAAVCGFFKLLFRWKGSIYKVLYMESLVFLLAYYSIAFIYRLLLSDPQQRQFERFSLYCREFTSVVPITFILGFYVTLLAKRWWEKFLAIPWPDRVVLMIGCYVQGTDERSRMIRRTLARYLELSNVLLFRCISAVIKKRFPTIDHVEKSGLLTADERKVLESSNTSNGLWWIPCSWFTQVTSQARKEGRIVDDYHLKSIMDEMLGYRKCLGYAWDTDWITVPLVYTQVATISVYTFFTACVFGRQYLYIMPGNEQQSALNQGDYYFPFFTFFQFFFYMGWLKVAETTITPYGEDDDDYELNWIIDRNIQVGLYVVDNLHGVWPKLTKDPFWDEKEPELPYTAGASEYRRAPFLGSTFNMDINSKEMNWVKPEQISSRRNTVISQNSDSGGETVDDAVFQNKQLPVLLRGISRPARFGSVNSVDSNLIRAASRLTSSHQKLAHRYSNSKKRDRRKRSTKADHEEIRKRMSDNAGDIQMSSPDVENSDGEKAPEKRTGHRMRTKNSQADSEVSISSTNSSPNSVTPSESDESYRGLEAIEEPDYEGTSNSSTGTLVYTKGKPSNQSEKMTTVREGMVLPGAGNKV